MNTYAMLCSLAFGALLLVVLSARPAHGQSDVSPPAPLAPVPTPRQLAWQDCEMDLFVHFGVNTFTDREWGEGTEDPKIFNPVKLDASQWVRAAKAAGFKIIILTAKHHDGFCLWPSKYTEHSVKNSPWRDGNGDVVRELAEACRTEGMKLGLYLSPWDRHEKTYGDSPKYNDHYVNQLTELLTNYGPVAEVWFDGACGEGPNGKRQEYDWDRFYVTVRALQPEAAIFGGPDIRWIGNEAGTAGDPCWSTYDPKRVQSKEWNAEREGALQHGHPDGPLWQPGECDVSIRPGWFWHKREDEKVRTVENLVALFFKSVGRNSLLLLNVPPNDQGLFSDADVKRLGEFRTALDAIFKTDLAAGKAATASNVRGKAAAFGPDKALDGDRNTYWATDDASTTGWIEVDLGRAAEFNVASMREMIALGQRVAAYHIDAWNDAPGGGAWQTAVKGTTIGHRKLDRFPTVTARRVRFVIDEARACPTISEFSLHRAPEQR
jgi:alpha-L-fucosidase